ncbi:MAG TPA: MBL fold metallo-hydrolase [Campylobacterales bacterium]|nr:MBL fold metallo-hydrolase [Campylobacterales bacterium]
MRYILAFLMLTLYGFGFNYHLEPTKITDGVSCFFGLYGEADEINGGRVVNSCFVETSQGYVVIDSGPTYSFAQQAYTAMQRSKAMPVKYVINTATDAAHVLGNEFYREQGAKLIGPQGYQSLLKREGKLALLEKLPTTITRNTRLVSLDTYASQESNLTLGDTLFALQPVDANSSHLMVYLPKHATLFAGNFVDTRSTPTWTSHSTVTWDKALATIKDQSWDYLIPAHGVKHRRDRGVLKQTEEHFASLQPKKATPQPVARLAKAESQPAPKKVAKAEPKNVVKKQEPKQTHPAKTAQKEEMHIATTMVQKNKEIKIQQSEQSCPAHINYQPTYDIAERKAKLEHKYLLVKIESNGCKPCQELNQLLATNCNIKKIINKHTKAIQLNVSYDQVPTNLNHMGTPALFLVQPENEKIVMHLEGRIDPQDLEESLKLFTDAGLAMAQ